MGNGLPLLRVRLFGKETIHYGDIPVLPGRNSITKAMKLLLILLYFGQEGISRNKLLENLYGREELADAANNLRVTIHRLKKLLTQSGLPEYEYIICREGVYYFESPMVIEVDTLVFKGLIAGSREETDPEKKLDMLKEACQLYSGEFLHRMSDHDWVVLEGLRCKELYVQGLEELCSMLMERKEYNEVLRLVEPACELYPFDEWQAVKIDCYVALNRYKDALKEYEDTAKLLVEELGVTPSQRMLKQFTDLSKHISNRPQVITEIKYNLQENPEQSGALYCTLPGFRDAYRVVRRGMERNGQSVFLLLCTLVDDKGRPMEASDKLDEMAKELQNSIKNALRRCDSFTKYNRTQFLVMLVGTNEENCQIAIGRVVEHFAQKHRSWESHLECTVSSLMDAEYQTSHTPFHKLK